MNKQRAFTATDYEGVEVVCSDEIWRSKVLVRHGHMVRHLEDARLAIAECDIVLQDRVHENRKLHVRRLADGRYVQVVVAYGYDQSELLVGDVVTAFLRTVLRRGDPILYLRTGSVP